MTRRKQAGCWKDLRSFGCKETFQSGRLNAVVVHPLKQDLKREDNERLCKVPPKTKRKSFASKILLSLPHQSNDMANQLKEKIQQGVWRIIDFFYPPFRKYFSIQFFRYGFVGGAMLVLDWLLYYLIYSFVFRGAIWDLGFIAFTPHIATLVVKWPMVFFLGFWLQRTISFSESNLKGMVQITRYFIVTICNLFMVYGGLKVFVEILHINAVLSNIFISIAASLFSYFFNKYFSFRREPESQKTNNNEPIA